MTPHGLLDAPNAQQANEHPQQSRRFGRASGARERDHAWCDERCQLDDHPVVTLGGHLAVTVGDIDRSGHAVPGRCSCGMIASVTGSAATAVLDLIDSVSRRHPLMVAIDGMSAAGKSTLAPVVVEELPDAELVRGDDFYRVMDNDERFTLSPEQGYDQDFDWQRLRQQVLDPLRAAEPARFQRYDWPTGQLGEWAEARPTPVVIVEGVYISRPQLRDVFDLVVWVDTSVDARAVRQSLGDDPPEWVARWDAAERYYIDHHQPAGTADLVVSGEMA